MAHGKTLELRKIGGGTRNLYLAPGMEFRPSRRKVKQTAAAQKRKQHGERKELDKLAGILYPLSRIEGVGG